jgi:hypothetical protein
MARVRAAPGLTEFTEDPLLDTWATFAGLRQGGLDYRRRVAELSQIERRTAKRNPPKA